MGSFESCLERLTGVSQINWVTKVSSCTDEDERASGVAGRQAPHTSCIGSRRVEDADNQEQMTYEDHDTRDFLFCPFYLDLSGFQLIGALTRGKLFSPFRE